MRPRLSVVAGTGGSSAGGAGSGEGAGPPIHEWGALLGRGDRGQILPTTANAMILVACDEHLRGLMAFDELAQNPVITRAPPHKFGSEEGARPGPYPRVWEDADVSLVLGYLQRAWCNGFKATVIRDAMVAEASDNRFHPVRDWISALKWDGKPRIDKWLQAAFGAKDSHYVRAVGARFLIAAVRRVRNPGCKFDHMMILEGPQGLGKSSALRTLFGEQWFTDSLPPDIGSRDAALALSGVWGVELPEIDQLIRAEVETVKAFLSRPVDKYRKPYDRSFVDVKRQCVFAGTTNTTDYLRDSSGNRRFWPIECAAADRQWIAINREQLFAEAAQRESDGEVIWLSGDELSSSAASVQQSRLAEDTWEEALADWLRDKLSVTTAEALSGAISVPKERHDRRAILRITACLRSLGWAQRLERRDGRVLRMWRPDSPTSVTGDKTMD